MENTLDLSTALFRSIWVKKRFWVALIVLVIVIVFSFRGCSSAHPAIYYTIARDTSWYPLNLMGKEKAFVAFTDELLLEIANEEQLKVEIVSVNPKNLLDGLDSENYDAILSSLQPTTLNQERYLFSEPFVYVGPVIIVSTYSNVKKFNDLKGKLVGYRTNSTALLDSAYNESIRIILYESMVLALDDLEKQRIDAVILDIIPAYVYTKGFYNGKLKVATPPLTSEGLRLITRKTPTSHALVDKFNDGINKIKDNGVYDDLLIRWGVNAIAPQKTE